MIVLDTNVVSELMRPTPDERVAAWVLQVPADDLHTTAITLSEILYGILRLSAGRRRLELRTAYEVLVSTFDDRVLPFGAGCVSAYASLVAAREARGRPIHTADAQIAAICSVSGASLATRDVAGFDGTGIEVIDPWTAG